MLEGRIGRGQDRDPRQGIAVNERYFSRQKEGRKGEGNDKTS